MGIWPGQAPIAMSPFCLLRIKSVPSEEDSAPCGVLAGLIQSVIAISSVKYTVVKVNFFGFTGPDEK